VEATIDDIHAAFKSGRLTTRQLVRGYLDQTAGSSKQDAIRMKYQSTSWSPAPSSVAR
jgi:hypothetical protein